MSESELKNPEEVSTPGADSEEIIARLKGELEVSLAANRELRAEVDELKAQNKVFAQKVQHLMGQPRSVERKHAPAASEE